ncbi:MAG: formate dehydrogenase accessory sulfurtransferase FdhD [Chloroflexi bacterium]|nr:formate dehydrogenase accessory sulfurtransferase FdhD [Chloroflexota bacterium]
MVSSTHKEIEVSLLSGSGTEIQHTQIPLETEVTLSVNGSLWLSFRCTPEDLENLAVGFLFNESIIQRPDEISAVTVCDGRENVDVWLTHAVEKPENWVRTSGCNGGISQSHGMANVQKLPFQDYPFVEIQQQITQFLNCLSKMGELRNGLHTTLLTDGEEIISAGNDIGRHNTLDKIAGDCLRNKRTLQRPVLLTTGRVSSDMVLKAARMGVGLVISLHSASSLAIELASGLGLALVGHARRSQVEIFSHPELITMRPVSGSR